MNISVNRMKAIILKDYKEFIRNYAISTTVLVPLVLAFFYNQMGATSVESIFLPINMSFAMVTAFVQCCLLAEEKESNTLRSLMLSPATIGDILIGKSTLVFFITGIILSLSIYFLKFTPSNWALFITAIIISCIFYLAVGIICALFSNSVMEASVAILPVVALFTVAPMATFFVDKYPFLKVVEFLPSTQLMTLEAASASGDTGKALLALGIIAAWAVLATTIATVLFKKRMKDE